MHNNKISVQDEYPQTNDLNPTLIFQKWALGNVLNYSEELITSKLTAKEKQSILKKVMRLIEEEFYLLNESDKDIYPHLFITPSRTLDKLIDYDEVEEAVNEYVFKQNIIISEALQLAFKVQVKKAELRELKKTSKTIKNAILNHAKLMHERILSITHRVLLEKTGQMHKQDFILIIDSFIPEIFFKPSRRLKGIVYRNKKQQELFNQLAIHYQYPIVMYDDELKDDELILINVETQTIVHNPEYDCIRKYKSSVKKQLIGGYGVDSKSFNKYTLRTMISNYRDANLANLHPLFNRSLMYYTEPVIVAKGAPLTYDEWYERLEYIFKTYKGNQIMIRIPAFDDKMKIPYVAENISMPEFLAFCGLVYEPLMDAITDVFNNYEKERLFIVVPNLKYKLDFDTWKCHIKTYFLDSKYNDRVEVVFEFDNHRSMYEVEELRRQDYFLANIDVLANDYIPEYSFGRNKISYSKLRDSNLHADIQYLKLMARETANNVGEVIISGFHVPEESVFTRYVNIGHPCFMIPVHAHGYIIDIIKSKLDRKGKFEGVYEKDRDRVLFYREITERNKNSPNKKRPHGLYDKVRKLQKKNKEKKDKDKDFEDE